MKMIKLRSFVLAAFVFVSLPLASSHAQVGISVNFAPPVLPVYAQPPCPVAGYIWTPGYWAWGDWDYYWVPGVWVPPPSVGLLWTPPWWGWNNGVYAFNEGYWGPTVGFYGGINYGYGYSGNGYWGGRWQGNVFRYNTAVTRVNTTVIHNTYVDRNVVNKQVNRNRASFNGPNGVKAEANAEQKAAAQNARKMAPTSQQLARQEAAKKDRNLQASVNKGRPKADAIKSFNKREQQDKGAQELGAAGRAEGAGAGKAENKLGNLSERQGKGAGAGAGKAEDKLGKAENVSERHGQRAGARNLEGQGNKLGTENQGNKRNVGANQAKARSGKIAGGPARGPSDITQKSRYPQAGPARGANQMTQKSRHPQMGPPRAQAGGKRAQATGQQPQGKKKQGKPEERRGRR
jgi:WXXGXW repeat (2 copies)